MPGSFFDPNMLSYGGRVGARVKDTGGYLVPRDSGITSQAGISGMGGPPWMSSDFAAKQLELSGVVTRANQMIGSITRQIGAVNALNNPANGPFVTGLQNASDNITGLVAQAKNLINTPVPAAIPSNISTTTQLWNAADQVQTQLNSAMSDAQTALSQAAQAQPLPPPPPQPVAPPPPPPPPSPSITPTPMAAPGPDWAAMMKTLMASQPTASAPPTPIPVPIMPPPSIDMSYSAPAPAPSSGLSPDQVQAMIQQALAPRYAQPVYNVDPGSFSQESYSPAPSGPAQATPGGGPEMFGMGAPGDSQYSRMDPGFFGMGGSTDSILAQIDAARAKIQGALAQVPALSKLGQQPAPSPASAGMSSTVKYGLLGVAAFFGYRAFKGRSRKRGR